MVDIFFNFLLFLDLYLEFDDSGHISTKIYDKRDDFNFPNLICAAIYQLLLLLTSYTVAMVQRHKPYQQCKGQRAHIECSRSWVQSGQTKDCNIGICYFSTKHAVLWNKSKYWLARIRIMFLTGATCLSTDCCFSELAL